MTPEQAGAWIAFVVIAWLLLWAWAEDMDRKTHAKCERRDSMTFEQVAAASEDFGPWLHGRMRERRMGVRRLAAAVGMSASSVSRLARSERQPTLRTAVALIRALGAEEG